MRQRIIALLQALEHGLLERETAVRLALLAALAWLIAGFAVERAAGRQALHAASLAFKHPVTEAALEFRSEWPADLRLALELAAGDSVSVAPDEALRYLLFFNRDG